MKSIKKEERRFTAKEAAIAYVGGRQNRDRTEQPHLHVLLDIENLIIDAIEHSIVVAKGLVDSNKERFFPYGVGENTTVSFDIYYDEFDKEGCSFLESLEVSNFAALKEEPGNVRLLRKEVKSFLSRNGYTNSKCFFPENFIQEQIQKDSEHDQRLAVLHDLIDEVGDRELVKLGRTGVWNKLVERDRLLFKPYKNAKESTPKIFFDNSPLKGKFPKGRPKKG